MLTIRFGLKSGKRQFSNVFAALAIFNGALLRAKFFLKSFFSLQGSVIPFPAFLLQVAAMQALGNLVIISPPYH
jgi:hypothetical protein